MTQLRLTDRERLDRLRLIRSESIGATRFREVVERFGGVAAALDALPRLSRPIRAATEAEAASELDAMARLGARFLFLGEPDYPAALAAIDNPPPLLAARGDAGLLSRPTVAIVGSRNASALGLRFAASLAHGLGEAGFVVVSGMARGIDGAAHAASVDRGAVGVMAGGLARVYPAEHEPLAARIAEQGCLVSEQPVHWTATARDFPRRNRIVSGLSLGVVIVEAALKSGSLITARLANEQGREVFAVPGHPLDRRAEGTNQLIRQGATLVRDAEDIVEALQPLLSPGALMPMPRRGAARKGESGTTGQLPLDAPVAAVPPGRDGLLSLLGPSPVAVDDLVRASGLGLRAVQLAILELDLEGRIERHGDNRISLR